jgi:hypothetical protein
MSGPEKCEMKCEACGRKMCTGAKTLGKQGETPEAEAGSGSAPDLRPVRAVFRRRPDLPETDIVIGPETTCRVYAEFDGKEKYLRSYAGLTRWEFDRYDGSTWPLRAARVVAEAVRILTGYDAKLEEATHG